MTERGAERRVEPLERGRGGVRQVVGRAVRVDVPRDRGQRLRAAACRSSRRRRRSPATCRTAGRCRSSRTTGRSRSRQRRAWPASRAWRGVAAFAAAAAWRAASAAAWRAASAACACSQASCAAATADVGAAASAAVSARRAAALCAGGGLAGGGGGGGGLDRRGVRRGQRRVGGRELGGERLPDGVVGHRVLGRGERARARARRRGQRGAGVGADGRRLHRGGVGDLRPARVDVARPARRCASAARSCGAACGGHASSSCSVHAHAPPAPPTTRTAVDGGDDAARGSADGALRSGRTVGSDVVRVAAAVPSARRRAPRDPPETVGVTTGRGAAGSRAADARADRALQRPPTARLERPVAGSPRTRRRPPRRDDDHVGRPPSGGTDDGALKNALRGSIPPHD